MMTSPFSKVKLPIFAGVLDGNLILLVKADPKLVVPSFNQNNPIRESQPVGEVRASILSTCQTLIDSS